MMFFKALLLSVALEAGGIIGGLWNYADRNIGWKDYGVLYTTMDAEVKYEQIYLGGTMDCYFTPLSLFSYSPMQMTYSFRAGYDLGNIRIGYQHDCFHPVTPYATIRGNTTTPRYEGGQDRIFVRITN